MLTTTLKNIRAEKPCLDGWNNLRRHLGKTTEESKTDETPLGFDLILKSNGLDDALWCLRALPESMENDCRLLACDFAEPALEYITNNDERPANAIRVARLFALGKATKEELAAAKAAARAAAESAVGAAARAAAKAAAELVAWSAARVAAKVAAELAAWAAARAAARVAARAAAKAEQTEIFKLWIAKF